MVSNKAQKDSTEGSESNIVIYDFHWSLFFPRAQVVYITSVEAANAEILRLWTEHPYSVVGFDLEWKPRVGKRGQDNPVALVQLGSEERILLVQVSAMPGS